MKRLTEILCEHQKELAIITAVGTAIALEETYIGMGREMCSNLCGYSKEIFNQLSNWVIPSAY